MVFLYCTNNIDIKTQNINEKEIQEDTDFQILGTGIVFSIFPIFFSNDKNNQPVLQSVKQDYEIIKIELPELKHPTLKINNEQCALTPIYRNSQIPKNKDYDIHYKYDFIELHKWEEINTEENNVKFLEILRTRSTNIINFNLKVYKLYRDEYILKFFLFELFKKLATFFQIFKKSEFISTDKIFSILKSNKYKDNEIIKCIQLIFSLKYVDCKLFIKNSLFNQQNNQLIIDIFIAVIDIMNNINKNVIIPQDIDSKNKIQDIQNINIINTLDKRILSKRHILDTVYCRWTLYEQVNQLSEKYLKKLYCDFKCDNVDGFIDILKYIYEKIEKLIQYKSEIENLKKELIMNDYTIFKITKNKEIFNKYFNKDEISNILQNVSNKNICDIENIDIDENLILE